MPPQTDPNHLLLQAKDGDAVAREELIQRFIPFVGAVISRVTGRYVHMKEDDEASIGLIAFNEAIDCFDPESGYNFLTLAETIIRRRLIDFFRKEDKHRRVISLEMREVETAAAAEPLETGKEMLNFVDEINDRRQEIVRYQKELAAYGITFKDLLKVSPRHQDARDRALAAARVVASNPFFRQFLQERKALPLKALEKAVDSSRKTLERHRKYIIAIAVMILGEYEYLSSYIDQRKGGQV